MERRLELRREWAGGRDAKAAALLKQNEPFRGDIAFNTQPGHIPERARAIRRDDRAAEHYGMARHHEAVADTLGKRLDSCVFSDDDNAIEALEARTREREAERDRLTRYNATCRQAAKRGEPHGDLSLLDEAQRRELATLLRVCAYQVRPGGAFPSYALTNLGARIRADRERIEEIKRRNGRTQAAAEAGGVLVRISGEWSTVTFAEKPERSVIEELKAAGYGWGSGRWSGYSARLPERFRVVAVTP
jgi:hypothetical protein